MCVCVPLARAQTLTTLYCRSIIVSLFSLGGSRLHTHPRFMSSRMVAVPLLPPSQEEEEDEGEEGERDGLTPLPEDPSLVQDRNTVSAAFLRVLKLLGWKGFGYTQKACGELMSLLANQVQPPLPNPIATHVIQVL